MSLIDKGFGLTTVGFLRPAASDIKADLEERFTDELGPVDLDPRSDVGQEVGIHTGSDDDLWQLMEILANANDPRRVTGDAQDGLYALLGVTRKPASYSVGTATLTGTTSTVLASGKSITSPDGVLAYLTTAGATLAAATARATTTSVATGLYRKNSGNIYVALVGGTTGSGGGPVGTTYFPDVEVDGSVTWAFVGPGDGFATATIQAVTPGVVAGPAFGLTAIGTPTAGWSGVANVEDVVQGANRENDDDYRTRFFAELHGTSLGTVDAILAALLERSDVTEAQLAENTDSTTDADGLEPHSIEAVVRGSVTSASVGATLFATKPAGIKTNGTTSTTVADARGGNHTIKWTPPADLNIYLAIAIEADEHLWPSEALADTSSRGTERAKAAVLTFGSTKLIDGRDVDPSAVEGAVSAANIPGTLSVNCLLDVSPSPAVRARIPVDFRHVAKLDSTRTVVSVTFRTP